MNVHLLSSRLLAPACLLALAACQTVPVQTAESASPPSRTTPSSTPATSTAQTSPTPSTSTANGVQAPQEEIPVAVVLATTEPREGWISVALNEGTTLYLNPEPVVTRNDLTGVQAGSSSDGEGLLALDLEAAAAARITQITTDNPSGRLALIVGRTLMAAPGYSTPVATQQLVFSVGTEENATAAARAIAGVPNSPGQGEPEVGTPQ